MWIENFMVIDSRLVSVFHEDGGRATQTFRRRSKYKKSGRFDSRVYSAGRMDREIKKRYLGHRYVSFLFILSSSTIGPRLELHLARLNSPNHF